VGKNSAAGDAHQAMGTEIRSQPPGSAAADLAVIDWRRRQLLLAAFCGEAADELACNWRYDLHALIELVERGCEPSFASRILAPLDDAPTRSPVVERAGGCDRNQS
jgi:hypothetical protein